MSVTSYSFTIANYNGGNVPYFITAGYHYCKLLTPFKARDPCGVDIQYRALSLSRPLSTARDVSAFRTD